ncbi:Uncharacterized protein Fot_34970 [Forsythia ovata]|uniref:Uncharacterized protein n=1 Tax=Forsythia ovata TaxID=205694 RepID=A0ABD1SK73_9LAMI
MSPQEINARQVEECTRSGICEELRVVVSSSPNATPLINPLMRAIYLVALFWTKQQKRPSLSESDNEDIKKLFEIPDKEGSLSSFIDKNKVYELKYTSGQVVEALWWLPTDSSTKLFWLASTRLSHTTIAAAVFDPIEKAMLLEAKLRGTTLSNLGDVIGGSLYSCCGQPAVLDERVTYANNAYITFELGNALIEWSRHRKVVVATVVTIETLKQENKAIKAEVYNLKVQVIAIVVVVEVLMDRFNG